jgi:hypothetical protein
MTISAHSYSATLDVDAGHRLDLKDGSATMDESWAPHVQARITIAQPAQSVQELIDARQERRVTLAASATYVSPVRPAQSRTFDLGLRSRTIDHAAGEMTLELASDEALLQDDVLIADAPNTSALAYQSSLRSIINNVVLSRIGTALQPGTTDAPFRVLSDSTNMFTNPSGEPGGTVWTQNYCSVATDTAWKVVGTASQRLSAPTQADAWVSHGVGQDAGGMRAGMTAGKTYTVSGTIRLSAPLTGSVEPNGRARTITVFTKVGAAAYVTTSSVQAANVAGVTRLSLTFTVPVGATEAFIRFYHGHTAGTVWWDAIRLSEHDAGDIYASDYFDGDTLDTTEYGYNWAGTPNDSTSTRSALIDRSPELLNWQPGESSWDFIQPLFQAAGFRLYCDERRRWYLVDASFIAAGQVQLSVPNNIKGASDTISRDNDDWFDAALVIYKWNDSTDTQVTAYDAYAEPGATRTRVFEYNRPFPGPGAAQYVVRRAAGKGRILDLSAVSQYTVEPSQPVTATLPGTPIQTGLVARVTFNFADDTMQLTTRGLTDTPATAYVFGSPDISYTDVPAGMTYNTFDWSLING